ADTDARFRDVYKRGEIDAQINALQNLISQNASKVEVDAKKADLEKLIAATDSKIPTFPPWVAALISGIAVLVSIGSIVSSTAIANAAKDEGRRATREARAYSLIAEWRTLSEKIGRARDLFEHPEKLISNGSPNKANYAILVDVGNWCEGMSEQWRAGTIDTDVLRRSGLKGEAKQFWDGLQIAKTKLPNLDKQIADWQDLRWLATSPDAA